MEVSGQGTGPDWKTAASWHHARRAVTCAPPLTPSPCALDPPFPVCNGRDTDSCPSGVGGSWAWRGAGPHLLPWRWTQLLPAPTLPMRCAGGSRTGLGCGQRPVTHDTQAMRPLSEGRAPHSCPAHRGAKSRGGGQASHSSTLGSGGPGSLGGEEALTGRQQDAHAQCCLRPTPRTVFPSLFQMNLPSPARVGADSWQELSPRPSEERLS